MSGLLSQALANAQSAEQQIGALSGLPPAAQQVQAGSVNVLVAIVPAIQSLQGTVSAFAQQVQVQLKEAEGQVSGDTPLDVVKGTLLTVQNEASTLKSSVDSVTSDITAAANQIFGYSNELAAIESQLSSQTTDLQSKLNTARDEESSAKKKYYYLLALGPFGLIGLAVALALYLDLSSDVNDLESQASSLSAQISRQQMLIAATKQLGVDFQSISTKISAVKNTVDILSGDIANIINDVEDTSARPVIELYIRGAEQEVATLAVDAS